MGEPGVEEVELEGIRGGGERLQRVEVKESQASRRRWSWHRLRAHGDRGCSHGGTSEREYGEARGAVWAGSAPRH